MCKASEIFRCFHKYVTFSEPSTLPALAIRRFIEDGVGSPKAGLKGG